jgi:hypothetical protein
MDFNKTAIIANLKNLESVINGWYAMYNGMSRNKDIQTQLYEDLMFVRGLMDDIECNRITEFPLVERTNFMSGKTFLEEPDRPYYCSPSSETYWSM